MKADKICRIAYYANAKQYSKKSPRKYPREVGKLCECVFDEPAETAKTEKTKPKFDFAFGGFKQKKN